MVPPSRLHFFRSNFAPTITREECAEHPVLTVPELIQALFDVRERSYLSVATTFRGQVPIREVDEYMSSDANNKLSQFFFLLGRIRSSFNLSSLENLVFS